MKQTKMHLNPITLHENKANSDYTSPDCQMLLNMYEDFYSKIGFNMPWVGYFVFRENEIVGSCGFVGQPTDGKVEIAYWTFKDFVRAGHIVGTGHVLSLQYYIR